MSEVCDHFDSVVDLPMRICMACGNTFDKKEQQIEYRGRAPMTDAIITEQSNKTIVVRVDA